MALASSSDLTSLFYSIDLYVCPYASTIVLISVVLKSEISFEIRKCDTFNFVLFQDILDIKNLLRFHMNFRMVLSLYLNS